MSGLIYHYQVGPGPCLYRYKGAAISMSLLEGETSEARAPEALAALCSQLGRPVPPGRYPPTPSPPPPVDPIDSFYLRRAELAPQMLALWSAYNHRKLASGEWSEEDWATFFPLIPPVVIALISTGWGAAVDEVAAFDHVLATPQAKRDYLQILAQFEPGLSLPTIPD